METKLSLGQIMRGYAAEIRILPLILAMGTVMLGATFAAGSQVDWNIMLLVMINAFIFLYTAHLNDTLWDIRKGEYETDRKYHDKRSDPQYYLARVGFGTEIPDAPLLRQHHYALPIVIFAIIGTIFSWSISQMVGFFYFPLSMTGLLLALTYSAGLDKIPAVGDTMWELGMLVCLFCGYYAMRGIIDMPVIEIGIGLFIALVGLKILDSWYDLEVDTMNKKYTLPMVLHKYLNVGVERIRDLGYSLIYVTLVLLIFKMPLPFYPGLIGAAVIVLTSHILYRGRDMEKRVGLSFGAIGILLFIFWSIFVFLQV